MLQFFRRYQKFFFLIVAILTIFSFTFFGTYSAFSNSNEERVADKVQAAQQLAPGKIPDKVAEVEIYELPKPLHLKTFQEMLALQLYLEHVAPGFKRDQLELPRELLSAREVEKKAPELVAQSFTLCVKEARRERLLQQISLRETWEWEEQEKYWPLVKTKIPALSKALFSSTLEERRGALEALSRQERLALDQFAREQILEAHPEWIEEALRAAPLEQGKVSLRRYGGDFPFSGVRDRVSFINALAEQPLGQPFRSTGLEITVIEREKEPHLLCFADVLRDGTLFELLQKKLGKGSDRTGQELYTDLLKAIRTSVGLKKEELALEDYVGIRFFAQLEAARRSLLENLDASQLLLAEQKDPLLAQWQLLRRTGQLSRSSPLSFDAEELVESAPGTFSLVSRKAPAFYRLLSWSEKSE